MLKKYAVLSGVIIALILLYIATLNYPGGSQFDKNSRGFYLTKNYLSNLFDEKAVNGENNNARVWAVAGIFFLSMSFATFFFRFSKKIPSAGAASAIIKYVGTGSMVLACFVVTSFHDQIITLSGAGALLCIFYITVFLFRSKLHFMKFLSIICLLAACTCNFIYYTQYHLELLPVMQKVSLLIAITWILYLDLFTSAADFRLKKEFVTGNSKNIQ